MHMRTSSITSTRSNDDQTLETSDDEDAFTDVTRGCPAEASINKSPRTSKNQTRGSLSTRNDQELLMNMSQSSFGFESATWSSSAEASSKEHKKKIRKSLSTNESSSSQVLKRPKRRSNSFDEDLFSSKDLSAAFLPQDTAPYSAPCIAVTKVETSRVSLDDSFSPGRRNLTKEKNHSTKPDSSSTERQGGTSRGGSTNRGRRKRPSNVEEQPDEEAHSKEDSPTKQGAQSISREGLRCDSVSDLGTADPSPGGNLIRQGRRSSSRGRRSSTTPVQGPPRSKSYEGSSSEVVPKRRSSSFDEDLLSSKDISAAFPSQETAQTSPFRAITKVETSKIGLDHDSFPPVIRDPTTEKKRSNKSDPNSTERRGGRERSSSRGGRKRPSNIGEKLNGEEAQSKGDSTTNQSVRSSSRGGRRRDAANDLGTVDPSSSGENATGQGRRSSSRGRRSTTAVKGRPDITDESSASGVPKRRISSFDGDLLSSKENIYAAFPLQEIVPDAQMLGVTKFETSIVSSEDSFSSATMDSTIEKKKSTKSDSKSTGRRGGRGRSGSRERRKRPFDIEEKPDEEVCSHEDSPIKMRARSSSRGGCRRDSVTDPSSGENSIGHGRRSSSSRGKRRASSKDSGKRHSTEENIKQNLVRARSNSRGRRKASLSSKEDTALHSDPTQTSRLRSTSLDVIRRNASSKTKNAASSLSAIPSHSSLDVIRRNLAINPPSSSRSLSGPSSTDGSKHMLSSMSLHGNLEAKSWNSLQESFSTLNASENAGRGIGSRSGRGSRRMPKRMADQDNYLDSSLLETTKGLSETKVLASGTLDPIKTKPKDSEGVNAMPELGAPRRGPGLKELVKSVSARFSSKNLAIDSDDGPVNSSSSKSKVQGRKEEKKGVRYKMKKGNKKNDAQPWAKPRPASVGALFKSFSNLKFEGDVDWDVISETKEAIINPAKEKAVVEDVWVEPSTDSKRKKNKHDSSRTRSKKDTKKQQEMFGDNTTTGADSLLANMASNKSKGAARRSSKSSSRHVAINGNVDGSRTSKPASSRKIKFMPRKCIANDMPDDDDNSCENAAATLASTRSRRSSSSKTSTSARQS